MVVGEDVGDVVVEVELVFEFGVVGDGESDGEMFCFDVDWEVGDFFGDYFCWEVVFVEVIVEGWIWEGGDFEEESWGDDDDDEE